MPSEFLAQLLKDRGVPENKVEQFSNDLGGVILAEFMIDVSAKLTPDESKAFAEAIDRGEDVFEKLATKYAPEEMETLLNTKIAPILASYSSEVLL